MLVGGGGNALGVHTINTTNRSIGRILSRGKEERYLSLELSVAVALK
jgi:hypothetical protein